MPWDRSQRAYFFGCSCVGCRTDDERRASAPSGKEEEYFIDRYCSDVRLGTGGALIEGTRQRLNFVPGAPIPPEVAVARCVIDWIAELVPHGDHATPTYNGPEQPLVTVGRMNRGGSVTGEHFGLLLRQGRIHAWCHEGRIHDHLGTLDGWEEWWGDAGRRRLRYFHQPLDCRCGPPPAEEPPPAHPCRQDSRHSLVQGPVRDLLEAIERRLARAHSGRELQNMLRPLRAELEEPPSGDPAEGALLPGGNWDVIYPRLAAKLRQRSAAPGSNIRSATKRGTKTAATAPEDALFEPEEETTLPAPATAESPVARTAPEGERNSLPWFGILWLDLTGRVNKVSLPWSDIQRNWKAGHYVARDVIFMVRGTQLGVDLILDDICQLHASLNGSIPAQALPPNGGYYIYAYHGVPNWGDVFYVGKGQRNRFRNHIDAVYRLIQARTPGSPGKEQRIEAYLRTNALYSWPADATTITLRYNAAIQPPPVN